MFSILLIIIIHFIFFNNKFNFLKLYFTLVTKNLKVLIFLKIPCETTIIYNTIIIFLEHLFLILFSKLKIHI
jgi:hypothetical protein